MNTITVLVGLPGSGKSTWCSKCKDEVVLSSDSIRGELFGDEAIQGNPKEIFDLLKERLKNALADGKDVVVDATNMTVWERSDYIKIAKEYNCRVVAKIFTTSPEECRRRNQNREREVPEFVYVKMMAKYQSPTIEEGFDEIDLVKTEEEQL